MAPEFFPLFFCMFLVGAIVVVAIAAVYVERTRRILGFVFAFVLKYLRPLLLFALVPIVLMLLGWGWAIRQQFFLNEPMASAAAQGNIDRVRMLLDRGASPDSWGVDFVRTALISAADEGHTDVVELLLSKGADPSLRDDKGKSPLEHAREHGHEDVVALLLKAGGEE
jgi:Ankyrin repeats (3 copies)